jgi:hypothetical protein
VPSGATSASRSRNDTLPLKRSAEMASVGWAVSGGGESGEIGATASPEQLATSRDVRTTESTDQRGRQSGINEV